MKVIHYTSNTISKEPKICQHSLQRRQSVCNQPGRRRTRVVPDFAYELKHLSLRVDSASQDLRDILLRFDSRSQETRDVLLRVDCAPQGMRDVSNRVGGRVQATRHPLNRVGVPFQATRDVFERAGGRLQATHDVLIGLRWQFTGVDPDDPSLDPVHAPLGAIQPPHSPITLRLAV